MPSSESESVGGSHRRRRLLSPSEKYEIWLQLTRGEVTMAEAAREYQVDRSVIAKLKRVARDGALASLSVSKPGPGARKRDYELEAAQDEVSRLTETVKEMAVKVTLLEGKDRWA